MSSFVTASIDSSADQIKLNESGQYAVTISQSGNLYNSSNYCVSFNLITSPSSITLDIGYPNQITCSSSGQYFAFVDQSNGVWYSNNYGVLWTNVYPSSTLGYIQFKSITANNDFSKLTALNESGTTYHSENNGITWAAYPNTTPGNLYNISGNSEYLIATENGGDLYRSSDFGQNWTKIINAPNYNYNSACISQNGVILYASEKDGIHFIYSTNSGTTWTTLSIIIGQIQSVSCDNDGSVASIISNDAGGGGIYYTVDTCTTLEKKNLVGPSDQWICSSVSGNGLYISSGDAGHNNVYTFLPRFVINLTFNITLPNTTIEIPLQEIDQNYSVNWGDSTPSTEGILTYTYSLPGTYIVDITIDSGTFTSFATAPWGSAVYLQSINSWSDTFQDLSYGCYGATGLVTVPTNLPINCTNLNYMFTGSSFDQNIGMWNISGIVAPGMTGMLDNCELTILNYDAILNGWAGGLNVPMNITLGAEGLFYDSMGLAARNVLINTYNWNIIGDQYKPFPPCYSRGTKILTADRGYIPVEELKRGDFIKTYIHGDLPIENIISNKIMNDPDNFKHCFYKLSSNNPELEDLVVTGGHGILVDKIPKGVVSPSKGYYESSESKIDDKYLLIAGFTKQFEKINEIIPIEYYHFSLKSHEGTDRRYGVWANGILSESTFRSTTII